jgi:hypothetical protein
MKISHGLRSFLTRKPTLVAVAGVGALGLLGGGALALDAAHSQAVAAATPPPSPSSSPSPGCPPHKDRAKGEASPGKVTAIDAGSITIEGRDGKAMKFTIDAGTRVRGPKKAPLELKDVHVGDYVAVLHGKTDATTARGIRDFGATPPKRAEGRPAKPCPSPKA